MKFDYKISINFVLFLAIASMVAFMLIKPTRGYLHKQKNNRLFIIETIGNTADTVFNLTIPKIAIGAPVLIGVDPSDKKKYDESLTQGVALMQGSSLPGLNGNIIIYGHSSATLSSPYEKIFAGLNDLDSGDEVKIDYKGNDYTYSVSNKKIVDKDNLSVLDQTKEETLTLITCWPIGTSKQRLIITSLRKK